MKKVFKFALVAFAAAAVAVACNKPTTDPTPTPTPDPDPDPQPEEVVPVTGESAWSLIGALLGKNWDTDWVAAENDGVFVVKNVKLETTDQFKFRKDKAWTENRGAEGDVEPYVAATGDAFQVAHNGKNISVSAAGVYDIYYNSAVEQFCIVAKNGTPTWKEKPAPQPEGTDWTYVMNMKNYKINCRLEFDPITVNTGNITLEWRFYANEWNHFQNGKHGKTTMPDGEEIEQWCNRLGKLANANDKQALLLRFSNDAADGTLCLNAGFLGVSQDNGGYVWEAQKWHTLSLTSDGSKLTLYDNGVKVKDYDAAAAVDWKFGAVDISETEDDGDVNWCKKQMFNGYLAYIRVWNRALSAEEITNNLCDVKSEGLVAGWNFNLDEGSKVENIVNGAPALDFSNVMGDFNRSGNVSQAVEGSWEEAPAPVCPAAE